MNVSQTDSAPVDDLRTCEVVLDEATHGHTLGGTAELVGVSTACIAEWRVQHPELDDAAARAGPTQRFYEQHLTDIVRRGGEPTRLRAIVFALVNLAHEAWRDKPAAEANVTLKLSATIRHSMKLAQPIGEGDVRPLVESEQTGQ